jgi:TPR repeat protein
VASSRMSSQAPDEVALSNTAIRCRDAAKYTRAYYWWHRAADGGDGDAWADVGYCLEHGIGVRRDVGAALRAYSRAIRSSHVIAWVQEEAHYRRGAILLSRGLKSRAIQHLRVAAAHGDYPEAAAMLSQAVAGTSPQACNCRRGLGRQVRGQARCILHRARNRHGA